jgi:hypothetical protein
VSREVELSSLYGEDTLEADVLGDAEDVDEAGPLEKVDIPLG